MQQYQAGQKLTIRAEVPSSSKRISLVAAVVRVNGQSLVIDAPVDQNKVVLLPVDSKLELQYTEGNAIFSCVASVTSHNEVNGKPYIVLHQDTEITRTQRRNAFRLPILLEGEIVFTNAENEQERKPLRTRDISCGGSSICTEVSLPVGASCVLFLPMEDRVMTPFTGEVRRCQQVDGAALTYQYCLGICFVSTGNARRDQKNEDQLIKFIFDRQREMRR